MKLMITRYKKKQLIYDTKEFTLYVGDDSNFSLYSKTTPRRNNGGVIRLSIPGMLCREELTFWKDGKAYDFRLENDRIVDINGYEILSVKQLQGILYINEGVVIVTGSYIGEDAHKHLLPESDYGYRECTLKDWKKYVNFIEDDDLRLVYDGYDKIVYNTKTGDIFETTDYRYNKIKSINNYGNELLLGGTVKSKEDGVLWWYDGLFFDIYLDKSTDSIYVNSKRFDATEYNKNLCSDMGVLINGSRVLLYLLNNIIDWKTFDDIKEYGISCSFAGFNRRLIMSV